MLDKKVSGEASKGKVNQNSGWRRITASVTGTIAALGMIATPESTAAEPYPYQKTPAKQEVNLQVSPTLYAYNSKASLYYIPAPGENVQLYQVTYNTRTGTIVKAIPYAQSSPIQSPGLMNILTTATNKLSNGIRNIDNGVRDRIANERQVAHASQNTMSPVTHIHPTPRTQPETYSSPKAMLKLLVNDAKSAKQLPPSQLRKAREAFKWVQENNVKIDEADLNIIKLWLGV